MATMLQPWQIIVAAMTGWITTQLNQVIDYLREAHWAKFTKIGPAR